MNNSPAIRSHNLSLWTFGHRRYYSPMRHATGGQTSGEIQVKPRVRPSLVLRSLSDPTDAASRASIHACEAQ